MNGGKDRSGIFHVIGLMSGTSLDGLDIAYCSFEKERSADNWSFRILAAETIPYSREWTTRLSDLENSTALDLARTDSDYGRLIGENVAEFIRKHNIRPDFIASHGHTIFHQPGNGFTTQIGKGPVIAAFTGLPVVCDFRSSDVALGGEGAPLVPVGDRLLFSQYDYCVNLGGFANISYEKNGTRIAFDICPANIILNRIARELGREYDEEGKMASGGRIIPGIIEKLDSLEYYHKLPPKSLGKEWLVEKFLPCFDVPGISPENRMRTAVEHISAQVSLAVGNDPRKQVLVTGGGALNRFLMEQISNRTKTRLVVPDISIVQFKEALIFAFLGVLRWLNEPNALASVTGARQDSSGGCIYL